MFASAWMLMAIATAYPAAESLLNREKIPVFQTGSLEETVEDPENSVGAICHYENMFLLCQDDCEPDEVWDILSKLGHLYVNITLQYDLGLDRLNQALELAYLTGNNHYILKTLQRIGYIYYAQGNHELSLKYYHQALNLSERSGNDLVTAELTAYIGNFLEQTGNISEAREYYAKTLDFVNRYGRDTASPQTLIAIGRYFGIRGKPRERIQYYLGARDKFNTSGNHRWHAYVLSELGYLWLEAGNAGHALTLASEGLSIARAYGLKKETMDNYQALSAIHQHLGNAEKSLVYYKAYVALKDSIFTLESQQKIAVLTHQYHMDLQQQEERLSYLESFTANLQTVNKKITKNVYLLAFLCILLLITVFAIRSLSRKRHLQELEARIAAKTNEMKAINKHFEVVSYVATHDLKSPIHNLQSLLNLIDKNHLDNPENAMLLEMINTSVDNMESTLKELTKVLTIPLETREEMEQINVSSLFEDIRKSIDRQLKEAKATIFIDFDRCPSIIYPKAQLKSILQNLLTNAIKFRSEKRPLFVEFKTKVIDGYICLSVKDNGIGMDMRKARKNMFKLFKRHHENIEGKGIGLYIVNSQVTQLGGHIKVNSRPQKGSAFYVYLKDFSIEREKPEYTNADAMIC